MKKVNPLTIIGMLTSLILVSLLHPVGVYAARVALVIGNSAYQDPLTPLKNPVNDATDMASMLEKLGFDVMLLTDVDLRQMVEATQTFSDRLDQQGGSVALFYFSGHGVQANNVQANNLNYLVPLRANLRKEADAEFEAFDVNRMLRYMEQANSNGVNLLILDACRADSLKGLKSWKGKKVGFAEMKIPGAVTGTLIAYATAPGTAALEREGDRNSIYTKHFLEVLRQMPELSFSDLLIEVRNQVMQDSQGEQVPWEASSLTKRFYFAESVIPVTMTSPTPLRRIPTPEPTVVPPAKPIAKIRLRSKPEIFSEAQAEQMFKVIKGDFGQLWPRTYVKNDFEDKGAIIHDHTTGLTWQKSGSSDTMTYVQAQTYIAQLNRERFEGCSNWRLPTMDELSSLITEDEQTNDMYINPIFDNTLWYCLSADRGPEESVWGISFGIGHVNLSNRYIEGSVRAVCSWQ